MKKRWTTWVAGATAALGACLFLTAGGVTLLPGEDREVEGSLLAALAIIVVLKSSWVFLVLRIMDR